MGGFLEGRHVLVTGGGSGIGAAVARALSNAGGVVSLLGRRADRLQQVIDELDGSGAALPADVTAEAGVAKAVKTATSLYGPISVLVNSAGAAETAPFIKTDVYMLRRMLDVNLTGAFVTTRAVLPDMLKGDYGRVITIASTAGLKGYAYASAYAAAKHGVIGMTRSLALECAYSPVTVNAICPGYTDTELLDDALKTIGAKTGMDRDGAAAALKTVSPQRRFIQPNEIANCAMWLCLPESSSVTGQALSISGGEVM